MKIFRRDQIREIDRLTIKNEPISSADLMERAAGQAVRWYMRTFDRSHRVIVFTGPGNNGGDGLSFARQLSANRFNAEVYHIRTTGDTSDDWNINRERLEKETKVPFREIETIEQFPFIRTDDVVVDAIFGSGLTRPVEGFAATVIKQLNRTDCNVVSVDIPSGLFCEDNSRNYPDSVIMADYTLSFQFPKLCFMFAENEAYVGDWIVLPIGLDTGAIRKTETPFSLLENDYVRSLLRNRKRFDHKGNFGHGLLVAGSYCKMGAALLGAKAALRSGIGLITCHVPSCGINILQAHIPEAMASSDQAEKMISDPSVKGSFDAAAIGPGIGTDPETQKAFHSILLNRDRPLVVDADGINILGLNKKWLSALPGETVITPHVKEFERLTGRIDNDYSRLEKQIEFASEFNCIVVLKGANTSIATPGGKVYFNSTGNPGMATAGSGDTLTGIILAFLSQGYSPEHASILGVYLHGLAGDIAAGKNGYESLIASDIIDCLGEAFLKCRSEGLNESGI